ncbi:MAG: ABC transporter ATP-binding protein [Ardenticatenaceae bacterium]|nr:ABC transporter ATP-binding protein [Ardenticatenaceae bacterium]
MTDPLVEIKDLRIHFFTDEGVVRAVEGIDLNIKPGKTLCVVGESGSGKSVMALSLLQIIHKPGQIVDGQILYHRGRVAGGQFSQNGAVDIASLNRKGRDIRSIRGAEIAMIFQEPMTSLSPMYTVGNQVMETIRLHEKGISKKEARERAIDILRRVRIPKPERLIDEYPFRLSGGMRQRVMIAMALSCTPSLLIADEPTTALDVTTQAQILDLMLELQQEFNMAIMFITHDLGVVAEIADDVAVMYLGNVVEYSDVDTIFNAPEHPYTQALLRSIPKISATRQPLDMIEGMVPSPFRRPGGCPFHPRCTQALASCSTVVPSLTTLHENHIVRCLLHEETGEEVPRG